MIFYERQRMFGHCFSRVIKVLFHIPLACIQFHFICNCTSLWCILHSNCIASFLEVHLVQDSFSLWVEPDCPSVHPRPLHSDSCHHTYPSTAWPVCLLEAVSQVLQIIFCYLGKVLENLLMPGRLRNKQGCCQIPAQHKPLTSHQFITLYPAEWSECIHTNFCWSITQDEIAW